MVNMWIVRVNEDSLFTLFKEFNCISIELEVPDLSDKTKDDINLTFLFKWIIDSIF